MNEEKCLSLLLNSISNQSFKDYEIIVADHHSTDNTLQIAKQYGAVITSGGLPGKGRNCGAAIAQGQYLLFLDADVILPAACFLSNIINEFEEKDFGVATCQISPLSNRQIDFALHQSYNLFILSTAAFLPHAPGFFILIKKEVHQLIKGFDEAILLAEDSDYVQRAGKISKFGILNSQKIKVSVRRLDKDGRLNITFKYILAGLHLWTVGAPKNNRFKYKFGGYK